MTSRFLICIFDIQAEIMFILIKCLCTLWVRVVGHEMPWSQVACKSLILGRDICEGCRCASWYDSDLTLLY